jgi:hypothetical protein
MLFLERILASFVGYMTCFQFILLLVLLLGEGIQQGVDWTKVVQDERRESSWNSVALRRILLRFVFEYVVLCFFSLFIMRVKGLLHVGVFSVFAVCCLVPVSSAECWMHYTSLFILHTIIIWSFSLPDDVFIHIILSHPMHRTLCSTLFHFLSILYSYSLTLKRTKLTLKSTQSP